MGKSQPKAPDPAQTAAAQGSWNSFTAQQQQLMNYGDQTSPWGSITNTQVGTTAMKDPNGKTVHVPKFRTDTTLTPEQQAIFDQTQAAELKLATIGNTQAGNLGDLLNDPFEYTFSEGEGRAYDLANQRIAPQQEQDRKALETRLINSGIRPGTDQYNTMMGMHNQSVNDQRNQLALQGNQQFYNQALQARNQQFNEPLALASGTQIQNPQGTFAATPQSQVAGVDYAGIAQNKYQGELQAYNAKMGALGGLFGGVTSMFKFSDERLKENIEEVGETKSGQPIYTYNYKGDETPQMGVMAQETPKDAVAFHPSGFMMVDYSKVH